MEAFGGFLPGARPCQPGPALVKAQAQAMTASKRRTALIAVLILALAAIWGCAHLSVRHLQRRPWELERPQTLTMKFWRFEYRVVPMNDRFGVAGRAYPLENVPEWADYVGDLWFACYLADENGRVLAQDLRVFVPQELDRSAGLPFEFILKPENIGSGGKLYTTFGYRMVLRPGPAETTPEGKEPEVFFASESAITY
jgi:hypothetical protein